MTNSDIIIIGGGAAGLMAAVGAGSAANEASPSEGAKISEKPTGAGRPRVVVLEKMPRVGRKIMISGKGRCNFTNASPWSEFAPHIHPKADFLKPAYYALPPEKLIEMFEAEGVPCVVERGDRAFPESHRSVDIVDALLEMARRSGAEVITGCTVEDIDRNADGEFILTTSEGDFIAPKIIITTGGLSYPTTGSTGDGLHWAKEFGHRISPLFPSLTALVPKGYKIEGEKAAGAHSATLEEAGVLEKEEYKGLKGHIDRATPFTDWGKSLEGVHLENVKISLEVDGSTVSDEFGDLDFTDGGIEGPIGFKVSRKAVWAIVNGAKVGVRIDLKPAVEAQQIERRIDELWKEIERDPRSYSVIRGRRVLKSYKDRFAVLLTKLLPKELIRGFVASNSGLDSRSLGKALKGWKLPLSGFVGYERCVVTSGGVALEEVGKKDLQSKVVPGLYFAGEVLNLDADTGGYNLHAAFCTGYLAGQSAGRC